MSIPPSLIGFPVAFLPVPLPQTAFVAEAVPEPTGPALFASAATNMATAATAARARPIPREGDLIELRCLSSVVRDWTARRSTRRKGGAPRPLDQALVKRALLASGTSDGLPRSGY